MVERQEVVGGHEGCTDDPGAQWPAAAETTASSGAEEQAGRSFLDSVLKTVRPTDSPDPARLERRKARYDSKPALVVARPLCQLRIVVFCCSNSDWVMTPSSLRSASFASSSAALELVPAAASWTYERNS